MWRTGTWIVVWVLAVLFTVAVRPFIPVFYLFEPCLPLLILSITLGRPRIVFPLIISAGLVIDAFQPFPEPLALFVLLGVAFLAWIALPFLLANRSFYSAVILVIVARLLIAGLIKLLGADYAVWSGDQAVFTPLFFLVVIIFDSLFLLVGFRILSPRLSGVRRETMLR